MAEDGEGKQEPPEDEGHRGIENAVMLGFFVVLVAAGNIEHIIRLAQAGNASP